MAGQSEEKKKRKDWGCRLVDAIGAIWIGGYLVAQRVAFVSRLAFGDG
jgi:hypothetical protein